MFLSIRVTECFEYENNAFAKLSNQFEFIDGNIAREMERGKQRLYFECRSQVKMFISFNFKCYAKVEIFTIPRLGTIIKSLELKVAEPRFWITRLYEAHVVCKISYYTNS